MRTNFSVPLVLGLACGTVLLCGCTGTRTGTELAPPAPATSGGSNTAASAANAVTADPDNATSPQNPAPYTPPNAAQLIRLLAPVAAFPDNLVAEVLAASTYPEQIAAAAGWARQHDALKGDALQNALQSEPWDPSVKALLTFPDVLNQMSSNLE